MCNNNIHNIGLGRIFIEALSTSLLKRQKPMTANIRNIDSMQTKKQFSLLLDKCLNYLFFVHSTAKTVRYKRIERP